MRDLVFISVSSNTILYILFILNPMLVPPIDLLLKIFIESYRIGVDSIGWTPTRLTTVDQLLPHACMMVNGGYVFFSLMKLPCIFISLPNKYRCTH